MGNNSYVMVVGAAIIADTEERHILCAQRSYPEKLRGRWELPGGKVEPYESPTDALHREVMEELNIEVTLSDMVLNEAADQNCEHAAATIGLAKNQVWPIFPNGYMAVWFAHLSGNMANSTLPALRSNSHLQLQWVPAHEIKGIDWLDGDHAIVEILHKILAPSGSPS